MTCVCGEGHPGADTTLYVDPTHNSLKFLFKNEAGQIVRDASPRPESTVKVYGAWTDTVPAPPHEWWQIGDDTPLNTNPLRFNSKGTRRLTVRVVHEYVIEPWPEDK